MSAPLLFEVRKTRTIAPLGGSGAAAGVLFGGILTKYLGWEWIFFVNVPVGAVVLALTYPIVPESHADLGHRRFDVAGAISVAKTQQRPPKGAISTAGACLPVEPTFS